VEAFRLLVWSKPGRPELSASLAAAFMSLSLSGPDGPLLANGDVTDNALRSPDGRRVE
jgi:hypothetical protein